jgi:RNA polymerase sigma factor (sigma-70 family)
MDATLLRRPLSLDAPWSIPQEGAAEQADGLDGHGWDGAHTIEGAALLLQATLARAADESRVERGERSDPLELLRELPAEQRLVVERVVLGGWSYRRTATALQVSPMTVQRRLQRGLTQLRRLLQP